MPLWGNKDNASNSDIAAVMQVNKHVNAANQALLYGNTTTGAFFANLKIGQFAVDTGEAQANPSIPHAGWVLRKEGTGGRAGRVTYEVLVAGGSYGVPDGDAANIANYSLAFSMQPVSTSAGNGNNAIFQVAAYSTPAGATIAYKWYKDGVALTNGGLFSGVSTNTLTVITRANVSGNVFTCTANTSAAVANLTSTGATLTLSV